MQGFLYGVEKEQRKLQVHKDHSERHAQHSTTTLEALLEPNCSGNRAASPLEDDYERAALALSTGGSIQDSSADEESAGENWGHPLTKPSQDFLGNAGGLDSAAVTSTKSPFLQWLSNVARLGEQQRQHMELVTLRYLEQVEKMRYALK